MIAVFCALPSEYINLIRFAAEKENFYFQNIPVTTCHIANYNVLIACSGPGQEAAYQCAQSLFAQYHITFVLSTGIAGSLNPNLKIGDIIISDKIIKPNSCSFSVSPEIYNIIFNKYMESIKENCSRKPNVQIAAVVSAAGLINETEQSKVLEKQYNGMCVETESGSVMQACQEKQINCAAIKIISDFANEASINTIKQTQFAVTKQLGKSIIHMFTNLTLHEYKQIANFK